MVRRNHSLQHYSHLSLSRVLELKAWMVFRVKLPKVGLEPYDCLSPALMDPKMTSNAKRMVALHA